MNEIRCPWCDRPFSPREKGGTAQRFCSATCRSEYHTACRQLGDQLVARGVVGIVELRSCAHDIPLLAKLVSIDLLPVEKRARLSDPEQPLTPADRKVG